MFSNDDFLENLVVTILKFLGYVNGLIGKKKKKKKKKKKSWLKLIWRMDH
jgi:hypothetical protein